MRLQRTAISYFTQQQSVHNLSSYSREMHKTERTESYFSEDERFHLLFHHEHVPCVGTFMVGFHAYNVVH